MLEPGGELKEAVAEYNRARTALQQALERGAAEDALSRARARVSAAEARLKSAQERARRAPS